MSKEDVKSDREAGWKNRQLCSDGNCIGVIGPDGCCKECGRPGDPNAAIGAGLDEEDLLLDEEEEVTEAADEAEEGDDEWDNRLLCADENCIGVVGADGRCKECGKPYES